MQLRFSEKCASPEPQKPHNYPGGGTFIIVLAVALIKERNMQATGDDAPSYLFLATPPSSPQIYEEGEMLYGPPPMSPASEFCSAIFADSAFESGLVYVPARNPHRVVDAVDVGDEMVSVPSPPFYF